VEDNSNTDIRSWFNEAISFISKYILFSLLGIFDQTVYFLVCDNKIISTIKFIIDKKIVFQYEINSYW